MKKAAVLLTLLLALLSACSESGPEVASFSTSDANPVTGQRIRLAVYATSDNQLGYYPMLYYWNCDGGILEYGGLTSSAPYWIVSETPGSHSATCLIKDETDKLGVMPFSVTVQPRSLETLDADGLSGSFASGLVTDPNVLIGGVYARLTNDKVWYFSTTAAYETNLDLATDQELLGFTASKTSYSGKVYDTICAVSQADEGAGSYGYLLTILYLDKATAYDLDELLVSSALPTTAGFINCIAVQGDVIWFGTDDGIYALSQTYASEYYTDYYGELEPASTAIAVNKIVIKDGITYAATSNGIYRFDSAADDPSFVQITQSAGENVSSLLVQKTGDDQYRLWTVAAGAVKYYDQTMDTERVFSVTAPTDATYGLAPVNNSLTLDLQGRIWNGKFYLDSKDATSWSEKNTDDEGGVLVLSNPTESIVSPEGLLYLFEGGTLKVWGKKYTE